VTARSKPPGGSPPARTESPDPFQLSGAELRAVAAIWRRQQREVTARFRGVSMEPTIPSGSELVLRCGGALAVSDVLAFVARNQLVVHRVVGLAADGGWILTCGDACRIPDPVLEDPGALVGRVIALRRDGASIDVPAPPRTAGRRFWQGLCLLALRLDRRLGTGLVLGLVLLRRWGFNVPRVLADRLLQGVGLR
jgi:hypothetical protein